ncbi:MAG: BrnA antitoxin family protein [Desulfobacterales bacterium]|nr:BrnA antitoxin family protein [Desulfobacterales bacterium]
MKEHYDFSKSIRNPFISSDRPVPGKTEIRILLDNDVVSFLKNQGGKDYKEAINKILRVYMEHNK